MKNSKIKEVSLPYGHRQEPDYANDSGFMLRTLRVFVSRKKKLQLSEQSARGKKKQSDATVALMLITSTLAVTQMMVMTKMFSQKIFLSESVK